MASLVRAVGVTGVSAAGCTSGHVQDVEQGRGPAEGTSCCSWSVRRVGRSGFGEGTKLGMEKGGSFGVRLSQKYAGRAAWTNVSQSPSRKRGDRGPVCMVLGVNGAFWEGADSDSPANIHFTSQDESAEKEGSVLLNLIREIEPLDVSLISKDASPDSTSAMKRTISGMLGLLPSDQFQVTIETPPDHLARLLVSSMMTGYTLRNAEYRLSLQRNLDLPDDGTSYLENLKVQEDGIPYDSRFNSDKISGFSKDEGQASSSGIPEQTPFPDELVGMSSEAARYIQELQAKLSATSKELKNCKNALSSLELVRQEKNDLLDYLRSLKPEKVLELSQPSAEVHEAVEQVVAGLLGTMVPKVSPQVPPFAANTLTTSWEENGSPEVAGNIPLQFQPTVTLTSSRDYLARLLFWCTLLGYHMRGLEYRLELSRTLSLSGETVLGVEDDRHDIH